MVPVPGSPFIFPRVVTSGIGRESPPDLPSALVIWKLGRVRQKWYHGVVDEVCFKNRSFDDTERRVSEDKLLLCLDRTTNLVARGKLYELWSLFRAIYQHSN